MIRKQDTRSRTIIHDQEPFSMILQHDPRSGTVIHDPRPCSNHSFSMYSSLMIFSNSVFVRDSRVGWQGLLLKYVDIAKCQMSLLLHLIIQSGQNFPLVFSQNFTNEQPFFRQLCKASLFCDLVYFVPYELFPWRVCRVQ